MGEGYLYKEIKRPCGPIGTNSQGTRLEDVNHTMFKSHSTLASSDVGGSLGDAPALDVHRNVIPTVSIPQHDNGGFVAKRSSVPMEDSSNSDIATQPKVQEAFSTNVSSNSGAKVVIPISVVEEMCLKFSNSLYGYFIGQRIAFPLVEDYVKHALVKFGFQKVTRLC